MNQQTENEERLISRRQMLGYCLAGAAGLALWRLRRSVPFALDGKEEGKAEEPGIAPSGGDDLTEGLRSALMEQGADLVGIGNLTELPEDSRGSLPLGICIAVKFPKEVVSGIVDLPTREYYDWYNTVNRQLSELSSTAIGILKKAGYRATTGTRLPHKTIATRAGVGWVGRSNLLVTESYGSMIRLASVLTDAPLTPSEPIDRSKCGECMTCVNACPAGALTGKLWDTTVQRDEILNISKCSAKAVERSVRGFGIPIELCGKCFAVCRYTQQYLMGDD